MKKEVTYQFLRLWFRLVSKHTPVLINKQFFKYSTPTLGSLLKASFIFKGLYLMDQYSWIPFPTFHS